MKKLFTLVIAIVFLFSAPIASAVPLTVPQGGSGVNTITGIIQGNGTAPFSPITVGSGLNFSGGVLTATGAPITGNPMQIRYFNNAGNDFSDANFTRDSATQDTIIRALDGGHETLAEFSGSSILMGTSLLPLFYIDQPSSKVILGDFFGLGSSTQLIVNDPSQAITFKYGLDSYTFPIGNGVGQLTDDGTGVLTWAGGPGGNFAFGNVSTGYQPQEIVYTDNDGNLYGDIGLVRDSVNHQTLIETGVAGGLFVGDIFGSGAQFYVNPATQRVTSRATEFQVEGVGGGAIMMNANTVNHIIQIGDVASAFNQTSLTVDDTLQRILGASGGGNMLVLDRTGGAYAFGDVNTVVNGTRILIDDTTQAITFGYGADSYTFPVGNATGVLTNDGTGNLVWGGGGGTFLIGQTSGLISAPTPASSTFEAWFGQLAGGGGASNVATTFIGYGAGSNATGADLASMVGEGAGADATLATGATFFGAAAGARATNAVNTTAMGLQAGQDATNASESIFFGGNAGNAATDAAQATFIGASAGTGAITAAHSIFIGFQAGVNDIVDNTVAGNSILIGDSSNTAGFQNSVGIGTGVNNTAANQFLVSSPTAPFTNIALNSTTGTFQAGDNSIIGNGVRFSLDDTNKLIFADSRGGQFYAGDYTGGGHQQRLLIDDTNQISKIGKWASTATFWDEGATKITNQVAGDFTVQDTAGLAGLNISTTGRNAILGWTQFGTNSNFFAVDDLNNDLRVRLNTGSGFFAITESGGSVGNVLSYSSAQRRLFLTNTRFEQTKGTNTAAANNLTLPVDGNLVTITGNTQINAITTSNWQAGSHITLLFTGTPTVKHNTAGGAGTAVLFLAGSVDLTASNNTVLGLVYDGTQWQETFRKVP